MENKTLTITLKRKRALKDSTLGTLDIHANNLVWMCHTLELPWKDNKPNESCIPSGKYRCERFFSEKFGETFIVTNVPGREGILFHAGNFAPQDTRGCILLGVGVKINAGKAMLLASKPAMRTFRQMLEGIESFDLVIEDAK